MKLRDVYWRFLCFCILMLSASLIYEVGADVVGLPFSPMSSRFEEAFEHTFFMCAGAAIFHSVKRND